MAGRAANAGYKMASKAKRKGHSRECYVSLESLADRLELAVSDVSKLVQDGVLPSPMNIGRFVRWRWVDVDAMIGRGTRKRPRVVSYNQPPEVDPIMAALVNANWDEIAPGPKRRTKR